MAAAWAAPAAAGLRLEDGRRLRVIFPGVAGGGAGPDFRGAIVDVDGDVLRGDVEIHVRASGWRAHGHALDPAYHGVVLHAVAENDSGSVCTWHGTRAIPIAVLRTAQATFPPPFTPPCALARRRGLAVEDALARLGSRRLRMKAARLQPLAAAAGPGPALYSTLLETLAGPANRAAFASIARALPLAALLERMDGAGVPRQLAAAAELKGVALRVALRRAGLRPMAQPARRLDAAAALVTRLWPAGSAAAWPLESPAGMLALLQVQGVGRGMAIELAVNAILPLALASGAWPAAVVEEAWASLPSPGTYGKLKSLERWLGASAEARPFQRAAALQGGLLLHADYCTAGRCGRCPLSF